MVRGEQHCDIESWSGGAGSVKGKRPPCGTVRCSMRYEIRKRPRRSGKIRKTGRARHIGKKTRRQRKQ